MTSLNEIIANFHFIRPAWLLILIPGILLMFLVVRTRLRSGQWHQHIDPELQSYMLDNSQGKTSYFSSGLMAVFWLIASFALAGPSWEKKPVPVIENPDALIILMDMSLSMAAQDVTPTRAVRAIHKATDVIRGRQDGQTAVIAYSGEAHTLVPFTDDHATIEHLLASLSPEIMPKLGSRPDKALALAASMMENAGIPESSVLLITDGIQNKDIARMQKVLTANMHLGTIAIGTAEGAPISISEEGFLKDNDGNIILPRLDTQPIKALAQATGSHWRPLSYDDSDWKALIKSQNLDLTSGDTDASGETTSEERLNAEQWQDAGFWLVILLIPLALVNFRRGSMQQLGFALMIPALLLQPILLPEQAQASLWDDLWQTKNQQAHKQLETDPAAAAELFNDSDWRGTASYRAGNYEQAIQEFAKSDNPQAHYNRGNALAQSGQLEDALAAYDKALKQQENFPQAEKNRALIEELLKQQQQNQQNQNQDSNSGNESGDDSSNQSQDGSEGDSEDGSGNESGSESQEGDQSSQQGDQNNGDSNNDNNSDSEKDSNGQQNQSGQQDSAEQQKQDDQYADQQSREQAGQQSEQQEPSAEQQAGQESGQDNPDSQAESNQQEQAAQSASQPQANNGEEQQGQQPEAVLESDELSAEDREQQAAVESLLNQVPDDPGLLMKRKFLYQYRQKEDTTEEDVLW